mgnify:CR=1 FL=1
MTFAEEYRKQLYKVVEVPSGFKFKIRKLTMRAFKIVMEAAPPKKPGESISFEDIDFGEFAEAVPKVLLECVVEPKLAEKPSKNRLSVYELDAVDQQVLFMEIIKLSGLTEENLEKLRSFR